MTGSTFALFRAFFLGYRSGAEDDCDRRGDESDRWVHVSANFGIADSRFPCPFSYVLALADVLTFRELFVAIGHFAGMPLHWRDYCAHILIPLDKCRRENFFLPFRCVDERHAYEKCQYGQCVSIFLLQQNLQ